MNDHTTPDETALSMLYRYGLPEDVIDGALCLHAQELAARIRTTDLPDWFTDVDLFENGVGWAADLIAPTHAPAAVSAVRPPATQQAVIDALVPVLAEPADRAAEEHRLALSEALGLGTGAPWDAIHDQVTELGLPPLDRDPVAQRLGLLPAYRAAVLREAAEALGRMDYDTDSNDYGYDTYRDAWNGGVMDAADLLRRLAAEPAAAGPDQTDERVGVAQSEPEPPTPRCAHCRHPKRDHDGRADHRERYSPLVAGDPWCHACKAECDYAAAPAVGGAQQRSRTARFLDALTHSGPGYDLNSPTNGGAQQQEDQA